MGCVDGLPAIFLTVRSAAKYNTIILLDHGFIYEDRNAESVST